jgi:hypothetical protein
LLNWPRNFVIIAIIAFLTVFSKSCRWGLYSFNSVSVTFWCYHTLWPTRGNWKQWLNFGQTCIWFSRIRVHILAWTPTISIAVLRVFLSSCIPGNETPVTKKKVCCVC